MSGIEIKRLREKGFEVVQMLSERDVENQKQTQQNKIRNFRYDIRYRENIQGVLEIGRAHV